LAHHCHSYVELIHSIPAYVKLEQLAMFPSPEQVTTKCVHYSDPQCTFGVACTFSVQWAAAPAKMPNQCPSFWAWLVATYATILYQLWVKIQNLHMVRFLFCLAPVLAILVVRVSSFQYRCQLFTPIAFSCQVLTTHFNLLSFLYLEHQV